MHSSLSAFNFLQNGSKYSGRFKRYTSADCWWTGTSSTAKNSKSYRPCDPTYFSGYDWLTHLRKAESLLRLCYSAPKLKDNIRASCWIKRTFGCITEEMWRKQFYLNVILNTVEIVCNGLGVKLGKSWKMYISEQPKMSWKWFLGLNSLEMVPVHCSSIEAVLLNMKELVDNEHRYKDNLCFSHDSRTSPLKRYGLSLEVPFWKIYFKGTTGERKVDLEYGLHDLFIYCDLTQPQYVGDTLVPLHQIVLVEAEVGQRISKSLCALNIYLSVESNLKQSKSI